VPLIYALPPISIKRTMVSVSHACCINAASGMTSSRDVGSLYLIGVNMSDKLLALYMIILGIILAAITVVMLWIIKHTPGA
jgi:hypothetical protein